MKHTQSRNNKVNLFRSRHWLDARTERMKALEHIPGNVSQAFHLFKTPQTLGVPSEMLCFPDDAPCQGKP
jgi:hypothetical protein